MPTQHFTTGQAAEYLEMPRETLRAWIHKGWLNSLWPRDEVGRWSRFTADEVVLLRIVKEFARVMSVEDAADCVGGCTGPIAIFFDPSEEDGPGKCRFVGVQLVAHEGKTLYAPHFAESLAKFQSEGVVTYLVVDLAAIPMPTAPKEPAQ
jgi:excisionase family DNA binding protein